MSPIIQTVKKFRNQFFRRINIEIQAKYKKIDLKLGKNIIFI